MRKLILASASPRRREILEKLGVPFVVEVSNYEEDMSLKLRPRELVKRFAIGKAEAVAVGHRDAIVIGADTVVEFRGKAIGKPYTIDKTISTLQMLNGKKHLVHTGYCIIDTKKGKKHIGIVSTKVTFRKMSLQEITRYADTKEPLTAAGAYMIQGGGAIFVSKIEGDYLNIVGMPLSRIVEILKDLSLY